jgi:hypothetical protein
MRLIDIIHPTLRGLRHASRLAGRFMILILKQIGGNNV